MAVMTPTSPSEHDSVESPQRQRTIREQIQRGRSIGLAICTGASSVFLIVSGAPILFSLALLACSGFLFWLQFYGPEKFEHRVKDWLGGS
jgi:hypothetical protein